jgi:hypothetical protein
MTVTQIKPWVDVIQGAATVAAVLLGGWWFWEQRSINKNIKLDQTVSWERPASGEANVFLVAVDVRATNIGKVKADLKPGLLEVTQVNPRTPKPTILYTDSLDDVTLEPGESAQARFVILPIYSTVKAIQVHTCYEVPASAWARIWMPSVDCEHAEHGDSKGNKYWSLLSVAEIGGDAPQKETESSVH